MPARFIPLTEGLAPTIQIQRPVILIGRHPDCDIRIDLPQISRRHCCLAQAYDRLMIRDLGSTNGVRVNGRLIDEVRLHSGDEIAIAQVIYRYEDTTPAPAVLPAPGAKSAKPSPSPAFAPKANQRPPSLPDLGDDDDLIPLDDSF
jgi:hypothetical protein